MAQKWVSHPLFILLEFDLMDEKAFPPALKEAAEAAAAANSVELVHLEIAGARGNMLVRVVIDKPGGVSVEDCAEVSRKLDDLIDDDLIPTAYTLEVSSPGLERDLYSADDFRRFVGEKAKVKLTEEVGGQKAFVGEIVGVNGDEIRMLLKGKAGEISFPHSLVAKANLRIDLEKEFKKRQDD